MRRPLRFWIVTAAAGAGCVLTLALAAWQLDRARQKLELQAAFDARARLAAVAPAELESASTADLLHRAARLRGTWVARHTVYLDNRQMQGRSGFYVVTPLQLEGSDRAVLVQRGWVPRDFVDRTRLRPVETPSGVVELSGFMAPPPAKLYEFEGAGSGLIRQNLDLGAFRAETGLRLLELSLRQAGPASEGLLREWPAAATGVEKHYGYAFQWGALSALIVILYVWFQFLAPRRRAGRDAPSP